MTYYKKIYAAARTNLEQALKTVENNVAYNAAPENILDSLDVVNKLYNLYSVAYARYFSDMSFEEVIESNFFLDKSEETFKNACFQEKFGNDEPPTYAEEVFNVAKCLAELENLGQVRTWQYFSEMVDVVEKVNNDTIA